MNIKSYCLFVLMMMSVGAYAQTIIKGTVKDANAEAIIGSNIVVKGTNNGTVTDIDGAFQIEVPSGAGNATLVVSSIGYVTQELSVGSQTTFDVVLAEDTKVLNEIVVTGYTSQRKDNITGAVAIVKAEELMKLPVAT